MKETEIVPNIHS